MTVIASNKLSLSMYYVPHYVMLLKFISIRRFKYKLFSISSLGI